MWRGNESSIWTQERAVCSTEVQKFSQFLERIKVERQSLAVPNATVA